MCAVDRENRLATRTLKIVNWNCPDRFVDKADVNLLPIATVEKRFLTFLVPFQGGFDPHWQEPFYKTKINKKISFSNLTKNLPDKEILCNRRPTLKFVFCCAYPGHWLELILAIFQTRN